MIIRQWLSRIDKSPAGVIDYSTMSHIDYSWLINKLIKLIIHSSSQSSSINQIAWLIIRQWFDNDWLINKLAWLIIRQWLIVTLNIHSSSQSSSINQLAWFIIRVFDFSTMIRQWLFNQPARVIDSSTMIESHWLFGLNQPTHEIDYSFVLSIEFNQPTRTIDYSCDWLFNNDSTMTV